MGGRRVLMMRIRMVKSLTRKGLLDSCLASWLFIHLVLLEPAGCKFPRGSEASVPLTDTSALPPENYYNTVYLNTIARASGSQSKLPEVRPRYRDLPEGLMAGNEPKRARYGPAGSYLNDDGHSASAVSGDRFIHPIVRQTSHQMPNRRGKVRAGSDQLDIRNYGEIADVGIVETSRDKRSADIAIQSPSLECPFTNINTFWVADSLIRRRTQSFESKYPPFVKYLFIDQSNPHSKPVLLDARRWGQTSNSIPVVPISGYPVSTRHLNRRFQEITRLIIYNHAALLRTLSKTLNEEIQAHDDLEAWLIKEIYYPDVGLPIIAKFSRNKLDIRKAHHDQAQCLLIAHLRQNQDLEEKFRDSVSIIGLYYKQNLPDVWRSFGNSDQEFWALLRLALQNAKTGKLDVNELDENLNLEQHIERELFPQRSRIAEFSHRIAATYDSISWQQGIKGRQEFDNFPVTLIPGVTKDQGIRIQSIRIKDDQQILRPLVTAKKFEVLLISCVNLHNTLLGYLKKNDLRVLPNASGAFLNWFSKCVFDHTDASLPVFGYISMDVELGHRDQSLFGHIQQLVILFVHHRSVGDHLGTAREILSHWYRSSNKEYCLKRFGSVNNFLDHFRASFLS
ncbi:hypothetical protein PGTUg99_022729 [Puccinia graminis f. sp. tritici]|uniref:Uncharacterized protein n=2 Tax=Puccinia graminis f. sp. tritici TaxID=56615 RepID=A0A5B0SBS4_PUCGR|nr:hypothetical protein PGTUg99_022729 [Puccinia graminis f. sp. tritici]